MSALSDIIVNVYHFSGITKGESSLCGKKKKKKRLKSTQLILP